MRRLERRIVYFPKINKNTIPLIGAIGAAVGTAALTLVIFVSGGYKYVEVPPHYAALTTKQRYILHFARDYGPRSGILYVWGGSSTRGFDCSGYVSYVYRLSGINGVPRTSYTQWNSSNSHHIRKGRERPGDAVYFVSGGSYRNPGHVGLYLGRGKMVEYYRSGYPARISNLYRHWGVYLGARRWWRPVSVRKHIFYPAMYVAKHWNIRIAKDRRWTVTFVPRPGRKTFAKWKRRAILSWAHEHHHPVKGYYSHINIRLH